MNLTLPEIEALTWFLAERFELWKTTAQCFGVTDPEHAAKELALAHAAKVKSFLRGNHQGRRNDLAQKELKP